MAGTSVQASKLRADGCYVYSSGGMVMTKFNDELLTLMNNTSLMKYQDANVVGKVSTLESNQPWYPAEDILITGVTMYQGVAPDTADTHVDIRVDGESVGIAHQFQLPMGTTKAEMFNLSIPVSKDQPITMNVVDGSGEHLTVRLHYRLSKNMPQAQA